MLEATSLETYDAQHRRTVARGRCAHASLEAGVDVHTIQRLLGHRALSTTSRYFHLAHPTLLAHRSPLDLLDAPATAGPTTAQA
jgi:site-specific recombinase XerD